ncbi:MAG: glycosyltransferase, partial [Halobacteriaceae archaeon]
QLEAMACNTPVIATDTPGPRSVAQAGGRVFSPGDIDELSRKIVQLLSDESISPRSIIVNQYSWEVIVEKWRKLYEEHIWDK